MGHNSVKSVGGVKALVLCMPSDVLYLYQVLPKYLKGFQSRVDARVVANADRWTYGQTYKEKTRFLYRTMPEAGRTKIIIKISPFPVLFWSTV